MTAALIILAAGALLALLAPFWMLFKTRLATVTDVAKRRARRMAACSAAAAVSTAAILSSWSFSVHLLNVLTVAGAFAATGALVIYTFALKPWPAWFVVGVLDALLWCLALLLTLLFTVTGYTSPVPADLGGGLHCRESASGLVPSANRYELEIFHRYLAVDRHVYTGSLYDEDDPEAGPPPPPELRDTVTRCRALLDRQRDAKDAVANPDNRAYTPAVAAPPGADGKR